MINQHHTEAELIAFERAAEDRAGPLTALALMWSMDPVGMEAILPRRSGWTMRNADWSAFGPESPTRTIRVARQRQEPGVQSPST